MSEMSVSQVRGRGVGGQAVLIAGSTGVAQVVTAILYVLAARSADPADFGRVVAALAVGASAVGFLDFGTNGLWVRELARGKLSQRELSSRLFSKLVIAAAIGLVLGGGSALVFPGSSYWMAAPVGFALLLNQTAQVPLRGMARADIVAVSILTDRAVALITLLLLTFTGAQAFSVLWIALTVGSLGAAAVGTMLTPKFAQARLAFWSRVNPWRDAGYYGLTTLAVSAQALDLPLLAATGGAASAGVYGAVSRWTQPMGLLASAFSSASAPFVARSKSWREALSHIRKGLWLLGLAVLGCLVCVVIAPLVVSILIGSQYEQSAVILQILALSTIPAILNQPLSVILQSMGHDRLVSFVMVGSVGLQLSAVAIAAPAYGAVGAAISFGFVQLSILISLLMIAGRASSTRNRKA
jgi:O-antigen/teichoic acid export membrane protein